MALGDTVQEVQKSLTGEPVNASPHAPDDLEKIRREEEIRDNLEKQIDHAIAEINANPAIDSQTRDRLVSNLRALKNGLGINSNLAQVQTEINDTRASAAYTATSNMLYGSLSAASQAAVNERVSALMSNDTQSLINQDMAPFEHWSATDKEAIRANLEESYSSPHSKAIHAEIASQPKEAVRAVSERVALRAQWLDAKIEHSQGAERELYEKLKVMGITTNRGFDRIVELEKAGAPIAEIEVEVDKLIKHKTEQGAQSMKRGGYQLHKMKEAYLATLSEDEASKIRGNDALISESITAHLDPDKIRKVELYLSRHKPVPEELKSTQMAMMLQARFGVEAGNENLLSELKLMVEIKQGISKKLESGVALSERETEYARNLADINNRDLPIEQRAQLLVSTVGARMPTTANLTDNGKLGFALVTLAFTDQHGGLEKHEAMLSRYSDARKSGTKDAEAMQYVREYNTYKEKKLMGESIPRTDEARAYAMQQGYELLGKGINDDSVNVIVTNRELLFYHSNDNSYEAKKSFRGSRQDLAIGALTSTKNSDSGIAATVKAMYETALSADADPQFVSIVRNIDTYRLQNDPGSEQLIKDVWLGKVPLAEIRERLDAKTAEERSGMQEYAGYAKARTSDFQREVLDKYPNLTNADGSLNMNEVMKRVESNKVIVYDYYQDYLKTPIDDLRKSSDPKLQHLAEARALSEIVSPMRSAHSLEHITERADALDSEISRITAAGGTPAKHLLDDQRLIMQIMQYNPNTATSEERNNFNTALKDFLMRDAYTADKEAADAKKQPGDRSNLVANTIALVEARLRDDPAYFRDIDRHGHTETAETPSKDLPAASITQTPLAAAELAARKAEGKKDAWDDLTENTIEDRVKKAVGPMAMADVAKTFGEYMVGANGINYNVGALDNITTNELENALRAAAEHQTGKILSNKDVVALFDTADETGKKNGLLSIEEIVAGLKKNGQLVSVAGGQTATVATATSAAPTTVPQVQTVTSAATQAPATGR